MAGNFYGMIIFVNFVVDLTVMKISSTKIHASAVTQVVAQAWKVLRWGVGGVAKTS